MNSKQFNCLIIVENILFSSFTRWTCELQPNLFHVIDNCIIRDYSLFQHICLSNRNHCFQRSNRWIQSDRYWNCWCFSWFGIQSFGMVQPRPKGNCRMFNDNRVLENLILNLSIERWPGATEVPLAGWLDQKSCFRLWCSSRRCWRRFAWLIHHRSKWSCSPENDQRFASWTISWWNIAFIESIPIRRETRRSLSGQLESR